MVFQRNHLPSNEDLWPKIFLRILGSPDPYGRQLDGLGVGISSLSKICVVASSERPDADVDYTFFGIGIDDEEVDSAGNCGNMSSAIGPYAFDHGLVKNSRKHGEKGRQQVVRIYNTNTGKVIRSIFPTVDGEALADGDYSIDGVGGTGAKITLDFLDPAGAKTGKLLPTGQVVDKLAGVEASCVDVANPCVFVRAEDVGIDGTTLPEALSTQANILSRLETIRQEGAVKMGLCEALSATPRTIPKVAVLSRSKDHKLLSGQMLRASDVDFVARVLSDRQPHRAIPLTAALCTAAAAKIEGSVVHQSLAEKLVDDESITIGHPSGRIQVNAAKAADGTIERATVYRTARRLMEGHVFFPD